jgi:hypothetical protein
MPKKERLVNLQEAIKKTNQRKLSGWVAFIIGMSLISIGLSLIDPPLSYLLLLGGFVLAIFGFYSINVNVRKESILMKELSLTPKGPTRHTRPTRPTRPTRCPSCGKKIPQENFDYCPFCGKSLKS